MKPISEYPKAEARVMVKNIIDYVLQVKEEDDKKYTELIDRLVLEFKDCKIIKSVKHTDDDTWKDKAKEAEKIKKEEEPKSTVEKLKVPMENWNAYNTDDIYRMLHYIAAIYQTDCSKCKTICCANQMLEIHTNELKALAKHMKMQPSEFRFKYTKTKQNFLKGIKDEEMSPSMKITAKTSGRVLMFEPSKETIILAGEKVPASFCPYYNKETHRCKIHSIRPGACRQYPFQREDDYALEIRKVTECVITDKFMERFLEFIKKMKGSEHLVEKMEKDIASKRYINHYYLPWFIVLAYMVSEFAELGDNGKKIAVDLMKRIEKETKFIDEKEKRKEAKKMMKNGQSH